MKYDFQLYLRDVVKLLREAAEEARRASWANPTDMFAAGRAMAYTEALSLMQSQADAFLIPREEIKLDDLDPASELAGRIPRT